MTITLRSLTSDPNLRDRKISPINLDGLPQTEWFAGIKPFNKVRAFRSLKFTNQSMPILDSTSGTNDKWEEKFHPLSSPSSHYESDATTVPLYVMAPLNIVSVDGRLNKPKTMNASLMALKKVGVEGIMVDAWWGLVEKDGPMKYNWEGYAELINMVQKHGLKLQVVMSFHQCGGNVGDSCSIPLPPWVLEEISKNPDLVYTDRSGRRNPEYISLGCDSLPVLGGRTPIQVYSDFMRSFRRRFEDHLGKVIVEIQVGMGPSGKLMYPSYPESNRTWGFLGIGEFQCYDKYMKASLKAAALSAGKREWGTSGPRDSGQYNQFPEDTGFFRNEGTWSSEYGEFFLNWYSRELIQHGDKILEVANRVFKGTGAQLSGKIAGIHWHYKTESHAAELTAGYYNTRHRDGYLPLARMLGKHGVIFNLTCMEIKDCGQLQSVNRSSEGLIRQVKMATKRAGVELTGENALQTYDSSAYREMLTKSRCDSGNGLSAFTFLRMNKKMFEEYNWRQLVELCWN